MIRVTRPATAPAKLSSDGEAATVINKAAYDQAPRDYQEGIKKMVISGNIYNHPSVKTNLKKAQHDKCCYCEKKPFDEPGAVEHFRPKSGFKSVEKEKLNRPGYYWLGYEWTNFYYTCFNCNNEKSNYFPLVNEQHRAKTYADNLTLEEPCLLEPGGPKDPRAHIVFDGPLARGLSDYGRRTIAICGLNRSGLVDERTQRLEFIVAKLAPLTRKNSTIKDIREAKRFLRACQKPTAPFSAVAIDFLRPFIA